MKRFSQWSPLTYKIAVEKNIAQRRLKDAFSKETFASEKQAHAKVLYDEQYIDPAKKKGC